MKLPIVENVPTPRESIFKLFPTSQHPYGAKLKKMAETSDYYFYTYFPLFPLLRGSPIRGPTGWVPAGLITLIVVSA